MGPFSRRLLVISSILCFIAAFALTPSEVRSRSSVVSLRAHERIPDPPAGSGSVVAPLVDPFVPQATDDGDARTTPVAGALPSDIVHLGPLPANAGAPRDALLLGAVPEERVRAIAVGPHASAIVSDGADSHLVGVGDRLGAVTVTSIDDAGITLSDRRRLPLATGQEP